MKTQGIVRFFLFALIIVCIYQLSFTVVTSMVKNKADKYAENQVTALAITGEEAANQQATLRRAYLDSVESEVVYNLGFFEYTYAECRDKQLNLGPRFTRRYEFGIGNIC